MATCIRQWRGIGRGVVPSVSAHTLTPLVPFVPHKDQGWLGAATSYAVRGVWR
jgi:hypothetical protein